MGTSAGFVERSIVLLGPVQVAGDDSGLAPRDRALLARLAVDAGRTVGVDRLVDDLWGEDPPATARNALQVYVSHLRARLGKQAVVSMGGGYRLEVGADGVDALVFERLVAVAMGQRSGGRPDEAIATLDEAGRLWRGDPLADLQDYPFAVVEAARLHEVRAAALEHLAEALLDTGDLDRLTGELGPAVRTYPFRERLRAAVMTGHYRQGRTVDALTLYAEVVDQLRDELGLEPGPTLQALQHAILNDDPELTPSPGDGLPTGQLTLVAAVLESPAALEGRLGELYGDGVLALRRLLRESFASSGGVTFSADAERLLAAFPSAVDAVTAADAAHRSLAGDDVLARSRVRVQIGVHTGTPRVVDRTYVGVDVHRVVRVAHAASGGQTIATAPTTALLEAHDQLHVVDLGSHRLPDLALPEHLHQVSTVAAPTFPPPRSLGARTSLPRSPVPLVGRAAQLATLVEEVARPGPGLVTLVGPGGTGKTRLAVEVAREVATTIVGGVYFVPLEDARTAPDVWSGLAAALGLPAETRSAAPVLTHLSGRRTLLVLDNLEQIDEVALVLEELLCGGDGLSVLCTSRRPTAVAGERLHRVEPLVDGAGGDEASQLFERCAVLARPDFVLDGTNREAVARICRRVDGLPLGIELAAARVRLLSPYALAAALDDGLTLVTGGPARPERQRDLDALAAWSVDRLTTDQQQLLELLAVFSGGVDLETVARIPLASGTATDRVTSTLELADASLVRISDGERPRVSLLETIRAHALRRLEDSGRASDVGDLHLAVHVELARRLRPAVSSRRRALETTLRERQNFERAVDHALGTGGPGVEAAAEIITDLGEAWHELGTSAFSRTQRTAEALPPGSPFRGWITYWDYRCTWDSQVDDRVVLAALERAEARLRASTDSAPLAALLGYGTHFGTDIGRGAEWGVARAEEAVALARELGQDWLLVQVLSACARAWSDAGDLDASRRYVAEAQDVARRLKDVHTLDLLTLAEARLASHAGRDQEAWALACGASTGLLTTWHDGTLFTVCSRLASLADPDRPSVAATLAGISLAALERMGSIPTSTDLERQYATMAGAIETAGRAEFDRLVDEGRKMPADAAVAWVLDLVAATTPA